MPYTPIEGVLDASWVGSAPYAPPITIAVGDWREGFAPVYPAGFRSSEIGTQFVTKQQFVDPLGWDSAVYGTALGTLDWQYIPPYAAVDGLWVGASSYTPPVSPFTAIWVVGPPSEDISVYGAGFESSVFGDHLTWWPQFASPDGIYTAKFGWATAFREGEYPPSHGSLHADWLGSPLYAPYEGWAFALWKVLPEGEVWAYGFDHSRFSSASHVWNKRQYIKPPGAFTESFGGADLVLTAQGASVGGIAPPPQTGPNGDRQIPNPFVDFRIRYLTPDGIAVPTNQIATTHVIAPDIQFIDLAGRGPNPWATGNVRIEYAVRYIEPPFIASNIFGSHNVARIQVVALSGWESSFISENHEFDINLQRVFHHSGEVDPTGYGETHVRNQFEILHPTGWLSQNINFPVVYNLDQYLFVQPYMDTNSDPTQWPPYSPSVENKIRTLGPGGWQSSRFSVIGNIVENTAAPLLPPGLDATLWGPETFTAPRIRYVGPEGWDSFYNTQYTVIYNNAAVLAPQGWGSAVVGTPEQVLSLNRTVKHVLPYGGETVGTAFIAYRVRTVQPSLFYDVPSGFPEVRFNPYPIAPAGIAPPQFGGHTAYEHFTIAYPKPVNVHAVPWVGEPFVVNRNRTVTVYPYDMASYGTATIFNVTQYLDLTAGAQEAFGSHLIRDRKSWIYPPSTSAPTISVLTQVRNVIPDPPAQQLIFVSSLDLPAIPGPTMSVRGVWVEGISGGGHVGSPSLTRNQIDIVYGIYEFGKFGTPALIYTQYLYAEPVPNSIYEGGDSDFHEAKPRVTPHTIYAPSADQATQQARQNHPGTGEAPHRIDAKLSTNHISADGGWPWFGLPTASNYYRSFGPTGPFVSSTHGMHEVTLRDRVVYPYGLRSQKFGLVVFLGVPQYVDLDITHWGIASSTEFGGHTVAPPAVYDPNVGPVGSSLTIWGEARVELLNRELTLTGIPHRGNPQQDLTSPWGLPLVGFPRVYQWGGYDLTLWGTTWVSHKNRAFDFQGWDASSFATEDISNFADRMRVFRRNPSDGIVGIGPDSAVGNHMVTHSVRTIPGRGISGYNSGDHIVKTASVILPAGWDSLEVGDIDRWEAGKIKPHGDDLSVMGTPRMLSPLRPSGPADGAVGAPRIGVPLYPLGIPEIGFAGPSVSNPFGCTNRVVTPLPVLSQQNVPQPVVT